MEPEPDITLDQDASALAETKAQSLAGDPKVPGYRLTERLGAGTFGEVWSAVQESTGQEVAVKLFHQSGLRSREMERLRKVSEHPHIVTLLDADMEASPPYLVMSLMRESLSSQRAYPPAKVLKWFRQMVQALHFVHERGLLHCDLKPSNVLTDGTENVRLADFGQSVALDQNLGALGSLGFMAPEQADTPDLPSVHWDVYGLGATTYALLTGEPPRLDRAKRQEIVEITDTKTRLSRYVSIIKNSSLEPIRSIHPEIDPNFATLVERCLDIAPTARTPSVEYLVEDLRRLSTQEPLLCRKPWSLGYRVGCFLRRHALAAVASFLLLCGLLAAGVVQHQAEIQLRSQLAAQQRERARSLTENGFGQRGLLWSAESLTGAPRNLTPRLQIGKFSPHLEHMVNLNSAPDTVGFSDDGAQFAASSASVLRTWNSERRIQYQGVSQSTDSPGADKPYIRPLARAWWSDTGQWHAVLQNKFIRGDEEQTTAQNQLLAAGGGTFVLGQDSLVKVSGPKVETQLAGAKNLQVACLAPDASWVVGQDENQLAQWDTVTGQKLWVIPAEQEASHLSVHPDGSQLASVDHDNTIRIRSTTDGSVLATLPTGRWAAYFAAFEPKGKKLFVCDASGRVRTWDTDTYRETSLSVRHQWLVYGVEFDSSGERFVTFSVDGTARIWSTESGEALTPFLEHQSPVRCASFDKSGERLITGALDGVIRVFRLSNESHQVSPASDLAVTAVKFVPETQQSVVALGAVALEGTLSGRQPGQGSRQGLLRLYDSLGKSILWERSFESPVTALALDESSQNAVVGFQDGNVENVSLQDGRKIWRASCGQSRVTSLALGKVGDRMAVASEDGSGNLYAVQENGVRLLSPLLHEGEDRTSQTTHPTHLEFDPAGSSLLTSLGDEQVRLWDASDGTLLRTISVSAPVRRAVFSPKGRYLAVAADDGTGSVWSLKGQQLIGPFQHEIAIWDLAFSPDGQRLATVSGDSTCRVWDLAKGLAALPPLEHGAPVVRATYSPDGRWLLTGAKDGAARLWDARTGEHVSTLLKSDSPVFALDFQQESEQLIVGSGDGRLHWSELDTRASRATPVLQRETQRKTGLRLTILPAGDSEVKTLTAKEWEAL